MVERSLSMREVRGSIPRISKAKFYSYSLQAKAKHFRLSFQVLRCKMKQFFSFEVEFWAKSLCMHRPGIEPGPPAWQASILPLNQRCLLPLSHKNIHTDCNFMFSAVCSCGRVVKATHSKWVSLWERRFESYQLRIEIFLACCNLAWNAQMSSHSNVPLEACETMWPNG